MLGGVRNIVNSFVFTDFVTFPEPAGGADKEVEPEALSDASKGSGTSKIHFIYSVTSESSGALCLLSAALISMVMLASVCGQGVEWEPVSQLTPLRVSLMANSDANVV